MYDAENKRFLAKDPYWNPGNMIYGDNPGAHPLPDLDAILQSGNSYTYCLNDPVNNVDPLGTVAVMVAYAIKKQGGTVTYNSTQRKVTVKYNGKTVYYYLDSEKVILGKLIVDSFRLARDLELTKLETENLRGDRFIHQATDEFDTEIDAVLAFAIRYNPLSVQQNIEWGANIYKKANGKYIFDDVVPGDSKSVTIPGFTNISGKTGVADVHTHGRTADYKEYFSGFPLYDNGDAKDNERKRCDGYLVTPNGVLKKLTYAKFIELNSASPDRLHIYDTDPEVTVLATGLPH